MSPTNNKGWLGKLSLSFEQRLAANGQKQTVLTNRHQRGPLTIQRPFYPEGEPCHLYLLHPPGGVVGGDRLELEVILKPKSHLVMTMPGATKFYRTIEDEAHLTQQFTVEENSILEWLPQDNILFSAAKANIKTDITLHKNSQLLGFESLCFGRPTMGEKFTQGDVKSHLVIHTPTGYGLHESLKINNGNCDAIGNYAYSATFFAYPADESHLTAARALLSDAPFPNGATCLEQLLVIRLLVNDNILCQHYLHQLWTTLRPLLLDLPACPPRIWAT